jgi:hypothetical protein
MIPSNSVLPVVAYTRGNWHILHELRIEELIANCAAQTGHSRSLSDVRRIMSVWRSCSGDPISELNSSCEYTPTGSNMQGSSHQSFKAVNFASFQHLIGAQVCSKVCSDGTGRNRNDDPESLSLGKQSIRDGSLIGSPSSVDYRMISGEIASRFTVPPR